MSIVHAPAATAEVIDDTKPIEVGQWYWYDRNKDVLGAAGERPEGEESDDEDNSDIVDDDDDDLDDADGDEDIIEDEDEEQDEEDEKEEEEEEEKLPPPSVLCCVTDIGSNYVALQAATENEYGGTVAYRVALAGFDDCCSLEADPHAHIQRQVALRQDNVRALMDEIRRVTAALGVTAPGGVLPDGQSAASTALATAHGVADINEHKSLLVQAKEKVLPDLFKKVEVEHKWMARWMRAELVPMEAQLKGMKKVTKTIEGRIFTVELYAGLVEKVTLVRDGAPAPNDTKVSLFQRRHYMDEECLIDYQAGGMNFSNIEEFDEWLAKPEHASRILPLARCVVAFRVRRSDKEYSFNSWQDFIRFSLSGIRDADKWTFLYIRNGERIYRLETKINFGSHLFPDKDRSILLGDPNESLWFVPAAPDDVITQSRYEELCRREAEAHTEHQVATAQWKIDYPRYRKLDGLRDKLADRWDDMKLEERAAFRVQVEQMTKAEQEAIGFCGFTDERSCHALKCPPYVSASGPSYHGPDTSKYARLTTSHVYYDDAMAKIREATEEHNRIAAVIQGLLDRSPVFQPHPPWRIFTAAGFAAGIDLVYDDDSRVLVNGDPPEFEEYRRRINASFKLGDVCVGQDQFWAEQEAEKHNNKEHRGRDHYDVKTYRPYGNPGPGVFARPVRITKTHAVFEWTREGKRRKRVSGYFRNSRRWRDFEDTTVQDKIKVPLEKLFNVSAYTAGDYKLFYNDPRTRTRYLQWAPFLLRGEDFAMGKAKIWSDRASGEAIEEDEDEDEDKDGDGGVESEDEDTDGNEAKYDDAEDEE